MGLLSDYVPSEGGVEALTLQIFTCRMVDLHDIEDSGISFLCFRCTSRLVSLFNDHTDAKTRFNYLDRTSMI